MTLSAAAATAALQLLPCQAYVSISNPSSSRPLALQIYKHNHNIIAASKGATAYKYKPPPSSSSSSSLYIFPQNDNNDNDNEEEKLQSLQKDIAEKYKPSRTYSTFPPILLPLASTLDDLSGEWALSYADLYPSTPRTIEGRAFLATNAAYALSGLILGIQGDWFFAGLTEMAGVVSFWYHFSQLEFGKEREEVRLALLTDYLTAGAALVTGGFYMADLGIQGVPVQALFSGAAAIVCLSLCWVWEFGYPYLFWHSLWHLLSAYTGYLVGQAHVGTGSGI